jgi:phage shock protein PspC (stress-responsive transcriptional regulator)
MKKILISFIFGCFTGFLPGVILYIILVVFFFNLGSSVGDDY